MEKNHDAEYFPHIGEIIRNIVETKRINRSLLEDHLVILGVDLDKLYRSASIDVVLMIKLSVLLKNNLFLYYQGNEYVKEFTGESLTEKWIDKNALQEIIDSKDAVIVKYSAIIQLQKKIIAMQNTLKELGGII